MKIRNKIVIMLSLIVPLIFSSCEDDDKNILDDFLKTAAFPKFAQVNPPTSVGVNQISDLVYSFEVIDGNNNMASYDLKMFAILGGQQTDVVDVDVATQFPVTYSFTAADLASLLGLTVNDIGFGDNFFFMATATTVDGIEYSGAVRLDYDDLDDDDPSTFELSGGGVTDDLLDEDGYRQAFEFGFVILCPEVNMAALPGTYDVVTLGFSGFFGETDFDREVIAGPGANQITIIDGEFPAVGSEDLVLNIDPNTGAVSLGAAGIAFDASQGAFDTDNYGAATGFVFTCTGAIVLTMDFDAYAGNAHPFVLQKQ